MYYEADDWPHGDWTEQNFFEHRMAEKQAAIIERERARTPMRDASGVPWYRRGKCRVRRGGCGRRGMVLVGWWRPHFVTRRCIFCLRWSQVYSSRTTGG